VEEIDDILSVPISPRAMEAFSSGVQPMLLNRCGTATCHGPAATSGFQLTRSPWGNSQPRRFTQRNLQAVLKLVDRASPAESKIVKIPQQPHGSAKLPLFGDRDAGTLKLLTSWIELLSAPAEARPAKIERPADLSLRAAGAPSLWMPIAGEEGATAVPLPLLKPEGDKGIVDPSAVTKPAGESAPGRPKVPATPVSSGLPRDPFDPAVFNRLHHGDTKP
jgi:hypothetical protein